MDGKKTGKLGKVFVFNRFVERRLRQLASLVATSLEVSCRCP